MNYNPYAAPQAAPPQAQSAQGAGAPQPWEMGEVLSQAWNTFKIHWAVLLISIVITVFISAIPSSIVGGIAGGLNAMNATSTPPATGIGSALNGASIGGQVLSWLVGSFFEVGLVRINLTAARGATPSFSELFSGGAKFLPMLALRFLVGLAYALGFLFLVVPGVILYCGLWASEYFLVDSDLGVVESMKASWAATAGQKGAIFLWFLVSGLINLGGALACCIGMLVTVPLVQLATAIIFVRISGRGTAALPAMGMNPGGFGPPGGYGGPPGGAPPGGYGGPPPGAPPGGYGPPPGGGGYGPPPGGGGGYGPPPGGGGGGYGPPGGGGGYGGGGPPPGGGGGFPQR